MTGAGENSLEPGKGVFIIAEAGVNHNGELDLAKKLIDAAVRAGADAVKFQTWQPGEITGRFAFKVGYLEETTDAGESRYELSNRLALPYEDFRQLRDYAERAGIRFLSTPDGFASLDFLVDQLGMSMIKVGSSEVTHPQFLTAVGRKDLPVILSTGLSTLAEVEGAVACVRAHCRKTLVVLQCTSEYPAPDHEMNLLAMTSMRDALGLPVGLSDHSIGAEAAIAATALGAVVIEKHFTLDRGLPGPDHRASMDPEEIRALVQSIRATERMMGDGIKAPTPSEKRNLAGIRRSVVAARDLKAGTRLEVRMMTCKRPGDGIQPGEFDTLVGKTVNRDLAEDEPLKWADLR
jgi:N-acetylneuraminate synthase/N,N'-diacetyllegionaminate synthase